MLPSKFIKFVLPLLVVFSSHTFAADAAIYSSQSGLEKGTSVNLKFDVRLKGERGKPQETYGNIRLASFNGDNTLDQVIWFNHEDQENNSSLWVSVYTTVTVYNWKNDGSNYFSLDGKIMDRDDDGANDLLCNFSPTKTIRQSDVNQKMNVFTTERSACEYFKLTSITINE